MKHCIPCTLLLLAILWKEAATVPAVENCLVKFERSLKETLESKKSCEEAHLRDCCEIAEASKLIGTAKFIKTGIYNISNVCQSKTVFTQEAFPPMQARCDMESNDGGWTVLVRRTPDVDKRELFNRTWEEYENGFGDLDGEFWYGLKNMHCLTTREPMEVEVEVRKNDGTKLLLPYGTFRVDGPSTGYTLNVSEKLHSHFDYFGYHDNQQFSTFDNGPNISCSMHGTLGNSGWWFNACYRLVPTAMPQPILYKSSYLLFNYAEMRVRPKKCTGLSEGSNTTCK